MSAPSSVIVRMYRNLLGDCFLLRLADDDGNKSHILIDCGLLQGAPNSSLTLADIAKDIRSTTGGRIDLLVITHEHYDHVSGFSVAKDILLDPEKVRYDNVWMAWTENPDDTDAQDLQLGLNSRKLGIAQVANAVGMRDQNLDESKQALHAVTNDLFEFLGPLEFTGGGFGVAPTGRLTTGRVMDELKKAGNATFHSPGDVLMTPGKVSLPAAVLGPPRNLTLLHKDLPSRGADKETYFGEEILAFSLLGITSNGEDRAARIGSPFSTRFQVSTPDKDSESAKDWEKEQSVTKRWLFDHYFAEMDDTGRPQKHRTIDSDWAAAAASLALKLDSDTNNTSLVLVFRLPDRTFLLFAADAQVGNWLSWHEQDYDFGDETLSATEILGRTRLYKVGHHGSHNATLKGNGLELMTRPDLVAMVSTLEDFAKEQGTKGWQMPNPNVKEALLKQTRGRLVRGDRKWSADADVTAYPKDPKFLRALDEDAALYVEFKVF